MDAYEVIGIRFSERHPEDAAQILERLPSQQVARFLSALRAPAAAAVLCGMTPAAAAECLGAGETETTAGWLAHLPIDVASLAVRRLSPRERERLLTGLPRAPAERLRRGLAFPEGTAAALADAETLALAEDTRVGDAQKRLRRRWQGPLYVVDRANRLVGVVPATTVLATESDTLLRELVCRDGWRLPALAGTTTLVTHPGWLEADELPVVDEAGTFLGALRHQTVRRLEQSTTTGAAAKAGLTTIMNLGELYWMGLSAFLSGVQVPSSRQTSMGHEREGSHGP